MDRKLLPLKGHKSIGMRTCHRAYCECGWSSEAHWERKEAWGEWRSHVLRHGGEHEPVSKTLDREERAQKALRNSLHS